MKTELHLKFQEVAAWLVILLVTAAAFWGTYAFPLTASIKALLWIGWLVVVFSSALLTTQGKRVFAFAKEAKNELEKVVWPTRHETIQTTSIVMIMVTVTGFILWLIDSGMMWTIGKITHIG